MVIYNRCIHKYCQHLIYVFLQFIDIWEHWDEVTATLDTFLFIVIYIRYNIIWKTLTPGEWNLVYTGTHGDVVSVTVLSTVVYNIPYTLVYSTLRFIRWHLHPSLIRQHLFLFGIKYYTQSSRTCALRSLRSWRLVYRGDFRFQYYFVQTKITIVLRRLWISSHFGIQRVITILLRWVSAR